MRQATRTQWIKCTIAILLYLAFLIWVRSWWGLIVVPFIFDIYITKKIPWSFWKKSKNPTVRSIMSWVDAIVFALVAVYFVNIYIFQNYQIPSSSLEKSLLVGDFLYVSKMSYGPRVPNTPLSMPLAQHTLPVLNTKSYIEWPQWKYKRVPGFGKVKLNDIVVFNFPAGDTVALNDQQRDFYSIAYGEGQRLYPKQIEMDSLTREQQRAVYDLYYNAGRQQILSNPRNYGKVVYRPVDRRENYVKRCVGLPGDTLQIVDGQVMIDGKAIENPENLQFNYFANYKKAKHLWNNRLELDYGLNKTKSDGTKKTNDKIYLSSTYGYEIAKNWYASGLMTFQTQFAKGYDYNVDPDVFISRFMSPGYLLIGAGFTWTPKSWFTATFTPATWRGTLVSSKILSDQGDFGVTPGKHLFSEFGANLRMEAKYEFLKNMTVFSRLNLYSNYLKDPQNVDISWDVQLNMAINQWFSCNITTNMIYDNDTKILQKDGTKGPRLQFKEALAVGFQVTF